jgi:4-hydroxybenzoyl-CoA reductase subunit beta
MTMPMPAFEYQAPESLDEAVALLADADRWVSIVGGGTDLFPKMKRRQLTPDVLVSLSEIPELRGIRIDEDGTCIIGATTLLPEIEASPDVPEVLARAAGDVASPQLRNAATIGGNLCVDTRCNWIDMSDPWRQASGYCLKDGGDTCWVAPRGDRCWAVSSTDLGPVSMALDGSVRLLSGRGERVIPVEELYRDDGMAYLTKEPDEILVELILPPREGPAVYHKLRRRGSIDFPILGVAAATRFDADGVCRDPRLVLGSTGSSPRRATEAEEFIAGKQLTDEVIEEAASLATGPFRPQDNTDLGSRYRKWMIVVYVARALGDLADAA